MVEGGGCRLCRQPAQQKCAGCLSVVYCSKEHQKLDWKSHKADCACFEVLEDKVLGRFLAAKREIKAGEVVIRERPLVSGPAQVTGPVCLGCHNALTGAGFSCGRCGWPVCSSACAESANHRPECHWALIKRRDKVKISNFSNPHPTYGCITALRVLYAKQTDPKLWSKISSLESHREERVRDGKWEQERFAVANLLRRFYKLEEEVTEEEVLQICGIIQINSHEVPLSEPGHISLYWKGSLLEHSCRPNSSKSFTDKGELLIRAAVNIGKGEHISICYTDPLWGTPSRQHHLLLTKYFLCQCQRCVDLTEYGTYFSAIACSLGDCKGKLLPSSFTDSNEPWKCNKCQNSITTQEVTERLGCAAEKLSKVDKSRPSSCKEFLDESEQLTENHCHRVEVKLALAQLIGQTAGGLSKVSDAWLQLKESLCKELLALSSLLFPAECRIRGVLYFELHAAVADRARREAARGGDGAEHLFETRKYLENAIHYLKFEPQALPEGRICNQAKQNLQDLEKLLQSMNVSMIGGL